MLDWIKYFFVIFVLLMAFIATAKAGTIELTGEVNKKMLRVMEKGTNKELKDNNTQIIINSPGGWVHIQFKILALMEQIKQKHKVQCVVPPKGLAASAAAVILMNCSEINASPNALILFHVTRRDGPNGEIIKSPWNEPVSKYTFNLLAPLATPEEEETYKRGEDVIYSGSEFMKRLGKGA